MSTPQPNQSTTKPLEKTESSESKGPAYGAPSEDEYLIDINGVPTKCQRVTSILHATKSNYGLVAWAGGLAAGEAERIRDESAAVGTHVHKMVECHFKRTPLPSGLMPNEEERKRFGFFMDWKQAHEIEFLKGERTVHSEDLLIAGTLDLDLMVNGARTIVDIKTGSLRRDAAVQAIVYAMLDAEMEVRAAGDPKMRIEIEMAYNALTAIHVDMWPNIAVLQLGETGAKFYEVDRRLYDPLVKNFLHRYSAWVFDRECRPFRQVYPKPKKEDKWLRAQ